MIRSAKQFKAIEKTLKGMEMTFHDDSFGGLFIH